MNLKEAIQIIKREGFNVEEVGNKYRVVRPCTPNEPRIVRFSNGVVIDIHRSLCTARELVGWARCYTADNIRNTKFKSTVKFFDHRKNRRKTKQCLRHELYDNIPSKKAVYRENRWNWD